jgi:hypothetical protein
MAVIVPSGKRMQSLPGRRRCMNMWITWSRAMAKASHLSTATWQHGISRSGCSGMLRERFPLCRWQINARSCSTSSVPVWQPHLLPVSCSVQEGTVHLLDRGVSSIIMKVSTCTS